MGALSNIVAFDYKKYLHKIVPALRNGEASLFVRREILLQNSNQVFKEVDIRFKNLQQVMKLFSADLSMSDIGKLFAVTEDSIIKTDRKFNKPEGPIWTYEDLAGLFEPVILRHCAQYFLSIGKVYALDTVIYSEDEVTQKLITKWDKGSELWCHGDGGFGEGISGWLSNVEVKELYERFDFVQYKPERVQLYGNILASLKELITISASEDLGVLYGNDLKLNLKPHFQYNLILSLARIKNENWDGWPTFENQIVKDFR